MLVVCDLDGVIWRAGVAIDGAACAVRRLRQAGHTVVFASNFSDATAGELAGKLEAMGIPASGGLVTAPMATARLLRPGERVLVLGGPGTHEAVRASGASIVDAQASAEPNPGAVDVVVVGFRRDVTWEHIRRASSAVRAGARFVATGTDATFPTPAGLVPGNGAIVAAIAVAGGREPIVAGKPHAPMADLITDRFGTSGWVVGDRPETDGVFARRLGFGWALVLSGVVGREDLPVDPAPDALDDSLAGFADRALSGLLPPLPAEPVAGDAAFDTRP